MPNYWPEVKTLKLFFQRTAMLRSVIYKTYFVFDTFRLSDEIFTKMKIMISPQETIIFLLDFYKFFTGVETSSFGNFKPNGIRTSPLRILKSNRDFFFIQEKYLIYQVVCIIFLQELLLHLQEMKFLYDFFLLKPQMLFYFSFRDKLIINISPFGIIIILY